MRAAPFALPLLVLAVPALAADEPAQERPRVACLAPQTIVPPFNNTPAAMEQSRIAATVVMAGSARSGGRDIPVCRASALAPKIQELEGVEEVPVDPDSEGDAAPATGGN